MLNLKWSDSEKKLARQVYDKALKSELANILAEFKSKAAAASNVSEMWALEDYLIDRRREIDSKYDYRYSQLLFVFARLIREGRIDEDALSGLLPEKRAVIRRALEY
jgi:hypothetical protein